MSKKVNILLNKYNVAIIMHHVRVPVVYHNINCFISFTYKIYITVYDNIGKERNLSRCLVPFLHLNTLELRFKTMLQEANTRKSCETAITYWLILNQH